MSHPHPDCTRQIQGLVRRRRGRRENQSGINSALPTAEIELLPLADGGEGTAETIRRARGGEWVSCAAHDALGREIHARYAWMAQSALAVLEMSAAAGLQSLLPEERNPVNASPHSAWAKCYVLPQATARRRSSSALVEARPMTAVSAWRARLGFTSSAGTIASLPARFRP